MSPFVTVYRVEHRIEKNSRSETATTLRRGMFAGTVGLDASDMPNPYSDVVADVLFDTLCAAGRPTRIGGFDVIDQYDWCFAFPSLAVLDRWVSTSDRQQLDGMGFVIRAYRLPRAAALYRREQVTFDPTLAVEVGTLRLNRLRQLSPRRLPA